MYQDRNGNEKSKPSHAQYPERSDHDHRPRCESRILTCDKGPTGNHGLRAIINIIVRDPIRCERPSPQTDIQGAV